MSASNVIQAIPQPPGADFDPDTLNVHLAEATAEERVAWALKQFGKSIVMTSSFGAQAAVCLHLVVSQRPDIPVILVDTGYLFPETYRYVDDLTERLHLNLQVYRAALTPAWQEARYGKLWEQGIEGLDRYNQMNKVEPMQRALKELGARAWITGLRRQQSVSRQHLQVLGQQNGRIKVHPLVDWTDRDIYLYMTRHELPYHPLWHKGYVSIGDVHTTRPLGEGMSEEDTRFFGLKRECGLHERA
ncbi:MAG TPA: phosphoadenylyl-sulfate reductase [Xanthobacteraceae bacterium]|nr:phosphoadenylyl-sulfate reductase [Xanthobacteraceae bacterium]